MDVPDLTVEEAQWLSAHRETCHACGHRQIFHSIEPQEHCEVDGCECDAIFWADREEQ